MKPVERLWKQNNYLLLLFTFIVSCDKSTSQKAGSSFLGSDESAESTFDEETSVVSAPDESPAVEEVQELVQEEAVAQENTAETPSGVFKICNSSSLEYNSVGAGTEFDPHQICNAVQLVSLANSPEAYNKSFLLTSNINLVPYYAAGGAEFKIGGCVGECHLWTDYDIPQPHNSFNGIFDGSGFTISGFKLTSKSDTAGFFGHIGDQGEVRNLKLTNASVIGKFFSGVLAGYSSGKISGASTNGVIEGEFSVGGLVGYNKGTINGISTSNVKVTGWMYLGGIAGVTGRTSVIEDVIALGDVGPRRLVPSGELEFTWDNYSGGILGFGFGVINRVAVKGNISGFERVGGIAALFNAGETGNISNSYVTATVTNLGCHSNGNWLCPAGGLVGHLGGYSGKWMGIDPKVDVPNISNSYFAGELVNLGNYSWGHGPYNGGLVGRNDSGLIVNSFSVGSINAHNAYNYLVSQTVSYSAGVGIFDTLYYWTGATCTNRYPNGLCAGRPGYLSPNGSDQAGFPIANLSDFYAPHTLKGLYDHWDFDNTWITIPNDLPVLWFEERAL